MSPIAIVYGTRPEAIKLGPCVAALRAAGHEPALLCTGQHTTLLDGTPASTDLAGSLSIAHPSRGTDPFGWVAETVPLIQDHLTAINPSMVVVQGDTMSVLAGAFAAQRCGIPVAHIEAGLRSHCATDPYPEEYIRRTVTQIAAVHLAPTHTARWNLIAEGIHPDAIHITGNPVVSALARYGGPPTIPDVHPVSYPEIIVTMHRREWLTTGPDHVRACVEAVGTWAAPWYRPRVFWPIHPHTEQILGPSGPTPILFAAPLAYDHMIDAVRHARGIVTDSGGLQEEAATLGIPCAVMRHVSDRPESIRNGLGRLFPPIPNGLTAALDWLTAYDGPRQPLDCYGTAESATAIADVLLTRPNTDAAS